MYWVLTRGQTSAKCWMYIVYRIKFSGSSQRAHCRHNCWVEELHVTRRVKKNKVLIQLGQSPLLPSLPLYAIPSLNSGELFANKWHSFAPGSLGLSTTFFLPLYPSFQLHRTSSHSIFRMKFPAPSSPKEGLDSGENFVHFLFCEF